jgi:hypothetical protein
VAIAVACRFQPDNNITAKQYHFIEYNNNDVAGAVHMKWRPFQHQAATAVTRLGCFHHSSRHPYTTTWMKFTLSTVTAPTPMYRHNVLHQYFSANTCK